MLNADEFIGPTQARQRLRLASMSNPIVHAVDMAARRDRLSDVDRYALMAYHLLQSADAFQRLALEQAQRAAPLGVEASGYQVIGTNTPTDERAKD